MFADSDNASSLLDAVKTYWGFDDFLPLQREAIDCVMADRDSLVVLPTGGGKSLCYQAPAVCRAGLAVVVSPLIALMKDQVDALNTCGIRAAAMNSSLAADEKQEIAGQINRGEMQVLYAAPEGLLTPRMLEFLAGQQIAFIAIDEAHCISAWGHDFRPEYRGLRQLRDVFPDVAMHGYTATATQAVRDDIAVQLGLRDPAVLVGDFRRKNLQYHVVRRERGLNQISGVLDRFRGDSGIVYAITRREVEQTATALQQMGYAALPYHAGLTDQERTRHQNAFLAEQVDCMVATVAFGMGIDKSNVRYVIHIGMPKSLENYQQESGRAGRDGVEAECWLIYSPGDSMTWRRMMSDLPPEALKSAEQSLDAIEAYVTSVTCRHRSLVEHFGQTWNDGPCNACDVCLDQLETVADSQVIGQKILSCVLRVNEKFGAAHVANVLAGSSEQRIVDRGHHELSTWGLLKEFRKRDIRTWIDQLVGQGFLAKESEYHTLYVTDSGRQLLAGDATPQLLQPAKRQRTQTAKAVLDSWEGVDRGLFEVLRNLRRDEAGRRQVPAYIVFGDATLRDMARRRPTTTERLLDVHGVGEKKAADFGAMFIAAITDYCHAHHVATNFDPQHEPTIASPEFGSVLAFGLFDDGLSIEQVAERLGRSPSTTVAYLTDYVRSRGITDPTLWISPREFQQVEVVVEHAGPEPRRQIYDALHGRVSYDTIEIAVACLANRHRAENQQSIAVEVATS